MANNTIEIKITADNAQAINALKQFTDFVRQVSSQTNTDGANAGKGFNEAFSSITSTGNKVIAVLENINSTVNKIASSFNPVARQGKDAMQQVTDGVKNAGREIDNTRLKLNKFTGSGVKVNIASNANQTLSVLQQLTIVINSLNEKISQFGAIFAANMQEATVSAKRASNDIITAFSKVNSTSISPRAPNKITGTNNTTDTISQAGSGVFNGATASGEGFLSTLSKISMAGYGIVGMFQSIKSIATTVFGTGLSFDTQMETAQMGIAGILTSMTNWNDRQMDLNTAMAVSKDTLDQINQKAATVGLKTGDLVEGFQSIIAPGLKAKMTLEEMVNLTVMGTKAVKSMLGPQGNSMQITQELRSMVSGTIDQNSQVSRSLGITNEGVEQAKQTAGGLFAYLQEKMSGMDELAKSGTWAKSMTGTLEAFESKYAQASGSAFETVFDTAKTKIQDLTAALFVVDEATKKVSFNPEVLSYLKSFVDYTILFGDKVIVAGKFVSTYLLGPLGGVSGLLAFIVNNLYGVTTALATWAIISKFVKAMDDYKEATIKARIESQALGNTGATAGAKIAAGTVGATVAMGRMEAAIGVVKIALRGLASATLWGAIAMAAGWALEKVINWLDKTADAKNRLSGGKAGAGGSSTGGNQDFGWLHAAHEGGYDTVSSGIGDRGGVSYGRHQFATNMGTPQGFVKWLQEGGWEVGDLLSHGTPGESDFENLWHAAENKYGDAFNKLQDEYAKALYYDNPNSDNAEDMSIALDANKRSKVMQEVVYSTAVQHGRGGQAEVMRRAAGIAGVPNLSYLTDEQAIPYIYEARRQLNPDDINRYNDEQQEAMNALAINPQIQTPGKINDGKISLKEQEQESKELANARIKQLEAQASGDVQKYIADLDKEASSLEQRYNNTKTGTAENPISVEDYITQRKETEQAKSDKELGLIQLKMSDTQQKMNDPGIKPVEKENLGTELTELQTQYDLRQKARDKVFQELNALNNTELQQLSDEEAEVKAANLEAKGKLEDAAKIRQAIKTRGLKEKFTANNYGEGLTALEQNNQSELLTARFNETKKEVEKANNDLSAKQNKLLDGLKDGTVSVSNIIGENAVIQAESTKEVLAKLNDELRQAKALGRTDLVDQINEQIKKLNDSTKDFLEDAIKKVNEIAQSETDKINADSNLTTGMKSERTEAVKKQQYLNTSKLQYAAADQLETTASLMTTPDEVSKTSFAMAKLLKQTAATNAELGRTKSLIEDAYSAGKQGLENGLTTFFESGYLSCKKLSYAVEDLAITILTEMNKVFANQLVKNLMNGWLGGTSSSASNNKVNLGSASQYFPSTDWQNPFKFADGGSFDSGKVTGPGTGTSDSILAYLGNYKKFVRIANGEYVIKASAARKLGTRVLDSLNNGLIPSGFGEVKAKYASGGSLSGRPSAGASDVAASLTSNNNVSVPLKVVNVTDPNEISKHLQSREGERVLVNFVKNNSSIIKRLVT
ncbi:MAG: hypothetical protein H6Q70_520 [Firmicutes bacterium]|nr:hypothetical protein [Bacillota bacterium]